MSFIQLGCGVDVKLCLSRAEQQLIASLKPLIHHQTLKVDSEQKLCLPQNLSLSQSVFARSTKQNNEMEILKRTKDLLLRKMQYLIESDTISGYEKNQ
jgi:hypothetical protein